MRDVARFLIRLRSFVLYSIGMGLTAFGAYGFLTWVPAFMGRVPGALIFYFPSVLVSSVTLGPIIVLTHSLVKVRMRALA